MFTTNSPAVHLLLVSYKFPESCYSCLLSDVELESTESLNLSFFGQYSYFFYLSVKPLVSFKNLMLKHVPMNVIIAKNRKVPCGFMLAIIYSITKEIIHPLK